MHKDKPRGGPAQHATKEDRLAEALRSNLLKRKALARARHSRHESDDERKTSAEGERRVTEIAKDGSS